MSAKKWNIGVCTATVLFLALFALLTAIIDPFLHYHDGLDGLEYPLKDIRYQNDGIARHYEYDSIITGTSMTQNFKTSEFESLWGGKTVKISCSGASFHESNENIRRALSYNPDVKYVLCSLDGNWINYPSDQNEYDDYPEYLYDNNPLNDVSYLLNKEVVPKTLAVINFTRAGNKTTSMDEYGRWGPYVTYGKEAVLASVREVSEPAEESVMTEADKERIRQNITDNFVKTARMYPDTTFYLFLPPYSACYWETILKTKQLGCQIDCQEYAVGLLLDVENIEVYDFAHLTDITSDLDNYMDSLHYGEWINSEILHMIHAKEGMLTKENYKEYYAGLKELYGNFDYSIYK